jgi:hypothetical protein
VLSLAIVGVALLIPMPIVKETKTHKVGGGTG